jgi:hypothetical protein
MRAQSARAVGSVGLSIALYRRLERREVFVAQRRHELAVLEQVGRRRGEPDRTAGRARGPFVGLDSVGVGLFRGGLCDGVGVDPDPGLVEERPGALDDVVGRQLLLVLEVSRCERPVGGFGPLAGLLEGDADARSLDRVAFRTEAEVREETERLVQDRLTDDRWERRQETLLDIVAFTLFPAIILLLAEVTFGDEDMGSLLELLTVVLIVLGGVALTAAMVIKSARALKYDVAPGLAALYRDPEGTVRTAWDRL